MIEGDTDLRPETTGGQVQSFSTRNSAQISLPFPEKLLPFSGK